MVSFLKKSSEVPVFSLNELLDQFQGLNPKEPGLWPIAPRVLVWFLIFILIPILCHFLIISDLEVQLDAERLKESSLKNEYRQKLAQAVNLEELRRQKLQVESYVEQLEKQLPGKAEMDALLSDINTAGLGRGLQFESFRPGQFIAREYYGEKLISIVVTGRYHDIGAFAADIAALSRIVNLDALTLKTTGKNSGQLQLTATARAYRYLDEAEIQKSQKDNFPVPRVQ
jgi:type IV pilus assembly protein PilO